MKINRNYYQFFQELNKKEIKWSLIKDYDYLMKKGYDNEIDLIAEEKDRTKLRNLAKKLGWCESSLNFANTHLIFWKFEGLKPFRIDIHMGRALATAVPWLEASDILKNRMKHGFIWNISPEYELSLLLMGSFRGRKPKPHRIKKAILLKNYLSASKLILKDKLTSEEVDKYYRYLVEGKIVKLSKLKRLGIFNIIKEKILLLQLFLYELFSPSPILIIEGINSAHKNKVLRSLFEELSLSKLNVSLLTNPCFLKIYWKRLVSDLVIVNRITKNTNLEKCSVKKNVENLISSIYP